MRDALLLMVLCFLLAACGQKEGDAPQDQARRNTLSAVDDSIRQMSPHARGMVERQLLEARDSITWYEFYLRKGSYYLYTAHPDSMKPFVANVIRFAEQQPATPRINTLKALAYEAEAAYRQNLRKEVDKIAYWRDKAYDALLQSDNKAYLPNLMANMADAYIMTNDLPKAAAAYRRALFLADSLKLPEVQSITLYMGLASIYMNLGDYQESLHLYEKSYCYLDSLSPKMQMMLVTNFGNYYYYRGQYKEALNKFLQLKSIVHSHDGDNSYFMYLCKINLSDVYLNLGELDKAEEYVMEADSFFRAEGVATGVYYANTIRMGICTKRKQFDQVRSILANEHIDAPIDHSLKRIRNAYLRDYYLATGNVRAAYDNKMREDRVEDSLAEERSYMRASEVIQRFTEDTLALHHKITIAQKESEKNHAQGLAFALVACVLILLLILAIFSQRARRRRMEGEISLLKMRMENARNRISPHFVFNILNNKMVNTNQQERDELMTLAKLIRRSLDLSHSASITLGEELCFVRDYVDLQRYVLRPDFDFQINQPSDGSLDDVQVPAMFVQILVENAIKHGLKGLDRPQSIHIDVTAEENDIIITVTDNGRGLTSGAGKRGTGLNTMFQTIDTLNLHNKRHPMDIDIRNRRNEQGATIGCCARLTVPRQYKYN